MNSNRQNSFRRAVTKQKMCGFYLPCKRGSSPGNCFRGTRSSLSGRPLLLRHTELLPRPRCWEFLYLLGTFFIRGEIGSQNYNKPQMSYIRDVKTLLHVAGDGLVAFLPPTSMTVLHKINLSRRPRLM